MDKAESKSKQKQSPQLRRLSGYGVSVPMTHRSAWISELEQGVRLHDEYGLGHLELWFEELPDRIETESIRRRLGSIACTLHAPFVDFSLTSQDRGTADASEARLWRCIAIGEQLEARAIAVHPGTWPVYEDKVEVLNRFVERIEPLVERSGAPLGFENLKPKTSGVQRTLIQDMNDIRELKGAIPAMKFTYDIGHGLQSGIEPVDALAELGDSIALFHLHDTSASGSSHQALGSCALSAEVLSGLVAKFEDRPVTLELLHEGDYRKSLGMLRDLPAN